MKALIDSFGLGVLELAVLNIIGVLGLAGPNFIVVLIRVGSLKICKTTVEEFDRSLCGLDY